MNSNSVFARFRRMLREFRTARAGNVAITFAFATLPIISAVGFAVDYSHANSVKAAMQAALDSTAMMISKEATKDTSSQLQTNTLKYFSALFTRPEATNVTITPSYTTSGGSQVVVTGSASVPTAFMGIIGYNNITVAGSSTVKWGNSRLRVALVLDNTGSMGDNGKLTALKTATNNLLTQLNSAATNNGDVYVSIIPFAKDVNLGSTNYTASWIDWTTWNTINGSCKNYSGWSQPQTQSDCSAAHGTWTAANHSTWNGCVTDRGNSGSPSTGNYDENVTAPVTGTTATMFPAEQYNACPQAVMGLSYNWSSMTTVVNNMQANGATNQPIGLVWGWQTLVGGGPFTAPAMDPNYTYSQVIILLSDGLNTQDRWYGDGSSLGTTDDQKIDYRMYDGSGNGTCANIKAAGITIYTIQVNTAGDPTSLLLQHCASTPDKFFLLTSATEIVTTFNTIGTNLSKLYVAK
jgi:Flp pilus assembly protein TadG